ncbi:sideroflexin-4 [Oenanthe melanoleuca]|uniref:sideroflexin-4 n=1 Tax=Oenanthe melanoleuca TaxID=2939378 RepID=UPI0024C1CFAD|nr:sideroflexin-4 [Oenanthe melanoleuca]
MDGTLRYWRAEGQSFFQRFLLWADALDPLLLLKSPNEIQRTRLLMQINEKSEPIQNNQTKQAFLLSLSSVHPDTDKIIPILFRPPAFMPITLPLVIVSSVQHQAKHSFFWQFVFHTYTTAFTLVNGNGTPKAEGYSLQQKQLFLGLGAISYSACIGALPLAFSNRYALKSPLMQLFVKKLLPAPLLGLMSAFTVAIVRSPEFDNGIEVMDRNGNVIGVSKKAGEKAVMETALSRAVLFGTTFFLPEVLMYFVQRARFVKNPRALGPVRMFVIMSVLAGMLPVSFSMFPQCGEIKRADLEPEILTSTEETEFFYNRGI